MANAATQMVTFEFKIAAETPKKSKTTLADALNLAILPKIHLPIRLIEFMNEQVVVRPPSYVFEKFVFRLRACAIFD